MARRRIAGGLIAVAILLAAAPGGAEAPPPALPRQMPEPARLRLRQVTDHALLAARVAGEPFTARQDLFEYLLDHPEFATHLTRALKLARYRIWRTPEGLALDDGWGTTGTFELVYAEAGTRVMYARGRYRPRVLPDITGQAVVTIDYGAAPAPDGRSVINATVTGYLRLDSGFLAWAARLAGPVATAKAHKEASRLVRLFARATRAVEDDPAAVYERVRRQPDVPARELEAFRRLLNVPHAALSGGPDGPGADRPAGR